MSLPISYKSEGIEVACDEVGRGCLAGPVYAAAVILDPRKPNPELNDSKKISPKKRAELKERIEAKKEEIKERKVERLKNLKVKHSIKSLTKAYSSISGLDLEEIKIECINAYDNENINTRKTGRSRNKKLVEKIIDNMNDYDEEFQKLIANEKDVKNFYKIVELIK